MSTNDTAFAGSIPAIYERCLVPLLFVPYAEDLAARVAALAPASVLETTAGTGVLTRRLAKAIPDARIVATDLNEAMIDVARAHVRTVAWQQADAQELPFADARFDVVVSQFGMMFLPDRVRGYREARRVLAPEGRFVFAVWDTLEANEVALVVARSVAASFPDDPPNFLGRAPYAYADAAVIRDEVERAGFTDVTIEHVEKVTHGSPQDAADGFCKGSPLRVEIEARDASRLDEVSAKAADAVAARFGSSVENRMRALVVTAHGRSTGR